MSEKNDKIRDALKGYPDDVFLYYGEISREGYHRLSSAIESRIKKKDKAEKACLILITPGGDADAAFRIARALRHHYSFLDILIPDLCKSAGTLICIAADRLIFGDRGEIGPLDVQISKPDEFFESMSGLNLIQALNDLRDQMLESFRRSFLDIRVGARLRTKMAAELAAELAKEFISPIVAKIDPVTLGEHQRKLRIAHEYGLRLNEMCGSLKTEDTLISLVQDYPSHEFVIDRKEARERLFKNKKVAKPDETTKLLYEWARAIIPQEQSMYDSLLEKDPPWVEDLRREQSKQKKDSDESQSGQKVQRSGKSNQSGQEADVAEVKEEVDQSGSKADAAEVKKEADQSG